MRIFGNNSLIRRIEALFEGLLVAGELVAEDLSHSVRHEEGVGDEHGLRYHFNIFHEYLLLLRGVSVHEFGDWEFQLLLEVALSEELLEGEVHPFKEDLASSQGLHKVRTAQSQTHQ